MAFDPIPAGQPAQALATGLANLVKGESGISGFCYVAVGNQPQGHLEVHAPSMEAVKLLMQTLGQWVAAQGSIVVPSGAPR